MKNWHVVTQSTYPHELEALEFVRAGISSSSHAFANFTFIGLDGSLNEVDLLVIGPWGFFLCEIKSRPGVIRGDAQVWRWEEAPRVYSDDNPLILAQRKCQKLKSLLLKQRALTKEKLPFLDPLIFLSHPSNVLALPPDAALRVCLRDTAGRPGILAALNRREGAGLRPAEHPLVSEPQLRAVLRALESIGLKARSSARRVGDYELGNLLYESPAQTVQDWEATHINSRELPCLARLYLTHSAATPEDREWLAKAAQRDFELIRPLDHPGLLRVETMASTERGPVVIFRYPKGARRLDHFLAEQGESLNVTDRLSILRQIAEAISYAHEHRVIHRGLTPQSVLVSPAEHGGWRAFVCNWQLGSSQFTRTDTVGTRSLHATSLLEDASTAYLAPEAISGTSLDAPEIDTFSLGAIAWRLFTGQAPAASSIELADLLRNGLGHLDIASVQDGLPASLRDLIQFSTHRDAALRYSVREFAQQLNDVEEELTRPEPRHVPDPRTARTGDWLEGNLEVVRRLGSGSVSIVFLVMAPGNKEPLVLKLAAQPEYNERLKAELATLRQLSHPSIVRTHDSFESGGIAGFLMDCAVELPREWLPAEEEADSTTPATGRQRFQEAETLAVRLRRYGNLEIDALQNFGDDLLKALEYVHELGFAHRDVKPDNIGIRIPRSKERVRLILFDFSLTTASPEEIRAGTPPYLDPFLPLRKIKRWDSHAERFAAAMTLYEMAAGTLPKWGDGQSAPHLLDCEVTILPELFIPDLRESFVSFFARALRRDYQKRFDTWDEMRRNWEMIFKGVDEPMFPVRPPTTIKGDEPQTSDESRPVPPDVLALATRDTLLINLGFSTRAFNALDRLRVHSVADLLAYPLRQIYRMPGVGNKTRLEIAAFVQALRTRFASNAPEAADLSAVDGAGPQETVEPDAQSIDLIARQLTVRRGSKRSAEQAVLERFLGEVGAAEPTEWISQSDAAPLLGVTRARVGQVVEKARDRWSKLTALTSVRLEIARLLRARGGVMTHRELIGAVLAARGSAFDEPQRTSLSSLVVRAAVETEKLVETPHFVEVRRGGFIFVALERALADWAVDLGAEADRLLSASADALPGRARAIEVLQQVPRPTLSDDTDCPMPDATRLVGLATTVAKFARASSRLELYPVDLPAERALLLCRSGFFRNESLTADAIVERVGSRFPEAQKLPADPDALAALLATAEVPLRWSPAAHDGRGAFVSSVSLEASLSCTEQASARSWTRPLPTPMPSMPEDVAAALLLEDRLHFSATNGSFLVLSVPPDRLARAETELLARFPVEKVDGDRLFLGILHDLATQHGIAWNKIIDADAAPQDSFDGRKLRELVSKATTHIRKALVSPDRTRLLTHAGLFARYGFMSLLEKLRDDLGRPDGPHGLWILIPAIIDGSLPRLNGQPVPVIGTHQHVTLPDAWLNNAHRGSLSTPA